MMMDPASPSSCLDAAVVAEIRALSGPGEDVLAEVLALFIADVPQQLAGLRAALHAQDATTARQIAHRLKGTALGIGARQMGSVCALVENAARAGDLTAAAGHADPLDDAFESARMALEQEVRRPISS
jgi:HPt (histidine-containing phosphotransfer) domain-containing protein